MKITNNQLKQIIKEELEQVMFEEEDESSTSPHFIHIMAMGYDGLRLVIKPEEGGDSPGVRIPTGAINNIHPKLNSWMNNMGRRYAGQEQGWHKRLSGVVKKDFYNGLKALIDRVDWPDSRITNYSIEDLMNTKIMVFSDYTQ